MCGSKTRLSPGVGAWLAVTDFEQYGAAAGCKRALQRADVAAERNEGGDRGGVGGGEPGRLRGSPYNWSNAVALEIGPRPLAEVAAVVVVPPRTPLRYIDGTRPCVVIYRSRWTHPNGTHHSHPLHVLW